MKQIICIKINEHSPVKAWQIPEEQFNSFLHINGIQIDMDKLKKDSEKGSLYYTSESLSDCYLIKIEEK